ncbi:hypothetical protein GGX14DRAFT_404486 [Mycena pura]|uniref:TEA domain-containing protein n=1 Tax=Mycena pura TaxID=153505 RepID=A0AAD6Y3F9_9AGAR|nr:hypothetical protein GGX14DRAFT_404486 [Mycena pura]
MADPTYSVSVKDLARPAQEQAAIRRKHSKRTSFQPNLAAMVDLAAAEPNSAAEPQRVVSTVEVLGVHLSAEVRFQPLMAAKRDEARAGSNGDTKDTNGDTLTNKYWQHHSLAPYSLIAYEQKFGEHERAKILKKSTRNKFISAFILKETQVARTPKQISSRFQAIRSAWDERILPAPKDKRGYREEEANVLRFISVGFAPGYREETKANVENSGRCTSEETLHYEEEEEMENSGRCTSEEMLHYEEEVEMDISGRCTSEESPHYEEEEDMENSGRCTSLHYEEDEEIMVNIPVEYESRHLTTRVGKLMHNGRKAIQVNVVLFARPLEPAAGSAASALIRYGAHGITFLTHWEYWALASGPFLKKSAVKKVIPEKAARPHWDAGNTVVGGASERERRKLRRGGRLEIGEDPEDYLMPLFTATTAGSSSRGAPSVQEGYKLRSGKRCTFLGGSNRARARERQPLLSSLSYCNRARARERQPLPVFAVVLRCFQRTQRNGGNCKEFGDQTSYVLSSIATSRPVYLSMCLSSQRVLTKIPGVRPAPREGLPEWPAGAISAFVGEGGSGAMRLPVGCWCGVLGLPLELQRGRGESALPVHS